MSAQLDLFDRLNALPPAKVVRGLQRYDVAYLSDGSHGGNRRQHMLLNGYQALCGLHPGSKSESW
jgi:hypothetical protein